MRGRINFGWSRRTRLTTATLLALAVLVAADGAGGWWPFASPPSVVTEPANGRPVFNGVIYSWRGLMQLAPASNRKGSDGLLVEEVEPDSAAAQAKVNSGDIISALDGIPVNTARSLAMAIAVHCSGPTVALSVTRDHEPRKIELPPVASASATVAARTVEHGVG
jgi:S1-C subfamily serine protease